MLSQLAGVLLGRFLGLGQSSLRDLRVLLTVARRCQVGQGASIGDDGGRDRRVQDGAGGREALGAVGTDGVMLLIAGLRELARLARIRPLRAASGHEGDVLGELARHDGSGG